MARNLIATVSESALRHNLQRVRSYAPNAKVMAVIKANGYGHGLVQVAKIFSDAKADALAVSCMEEASLIRAAGIQAEIVLIEGVFQAPELTLVQEYRLTMVVHHWEQVHALRQYQTKIKQPFVVWVKINTGFNRLGFQAHEFQEALNALKQLPYVQIKGFLSQFANADSINHEGTPKQHAVFKQIVGNEKGEISLANSAAVLGWPDTHADWVRPGIMLYGASPFPDTTGHAHQLKQAMTFTSEIIALQSLTRGEPVGYGSTWVNPRDFSKIAVIAAGYSDGYPRSEQKGYVLLHQQQAPIVGRINMDMFAIDVTDIKTAAVGDTVTLWGADLPIEDVSTRAGTLPNDLFCRSFSPRVKLTYIA